MGISLALSTFPDYLVPSAVFVVFVFVVLLFCFFMAGLGG